MTKDLIETLSAPFDPAKISWRVGSTNKEKTRGMALAYIDARDVMARLDEACGPGGWQCRYPHAGQKTICEIGVKVGDEWVWRADGAGDTDFEAEKGAISDAFKRAAVKWGVGRYLYDVDAPWVAIVAVGRSYAIADSELPKLQKLLPGSKAQTAPAVKNAPGVSDAKTWVREHIHHLQGCENAEAFAEMLEEARTRWVRICQAYPGVWAGPDGSGLRGEGTRIATIMQARTFFDGFVADVEAAAREVHQQLAAE